MLYSRCDKSRYFWNYTLLSFNVNFTECAVLIIENNTSILIKELYKDNVDVVIGDITHLKNNSLYIEGI